METGSGPQSGTVFGEGCAASADDLVERFEVGDVVVDDGFVDEFPERLGRLEFWRIGRQEDVPDAFWDLEVCWSMPTGVVEHENDDPLAACASFFGKQAQQRLEEGLGYAVRDVPEALTGCRRNERRHVEPFEAMMAVRDRPLADRRPDPAGHRLQAEPVLVGRERLDRRIGVARRLLDDDVGHFFLKMSCSSGVAAFGLRGRGF